MSIRKGPLPGSTPGLSWVTTDVTQPQKALPIGATQKTAADGWLACTAGKMIFAGATPRRKHGGTFVHTFGIVVKLRFVSAV